MFKTQQGVQTLILEEKLGERYVKYKETGTKNKEKKENCSLKYKHGRNLNWFSNVLYVFRNKSCCTDTSSVL